MSGSRLPSFFKTARHQRFTFEPRYYDPVKEDLEERESRIRRELNLENDENTTPRTRSTHIRGAFQRNRTTNKDSSGLLRGVIFVTLGGIVYYFWTGSDVVLFTTLAIPVIYYLLKRRNVV